MAIKLGVGSNLTSPQSGVPHRTSTQGPVLVFYCPFGMRSSTAAAQAARRLDSRSLAGSPGASAGGAVLNNGRGGSCRHNAAGWRIGTPGGPRAGSARTIKLGGVSAASALSLPVNRNRPARSPSRRPADSGPEHPMHSATCELEAAGVEFRFASRVGPPWPLGP